MRQDSVAVGPLTIARIGAAAARARIYAAIDGGAALRVAFCNAHTAKLAFDDAAFAHILGRSWLLNDGIGIELAARVLDGAGFPENLNGTDFVPALLAQSPRSLRLYLLGAKPDVVAKASDVLRARDPQHAIVGLHDGFFADADLPHMASEITAAHADMVLCAMGDPRQHVVMEALVSHGVGGVLIGVGALFDFLAGAVPRAPPMVRQMRLEFLYRLSREPRRLGRRYTVEIAEFVWAIARLRANRSR